MTPHSLDWRPARQHGLVTSAQLARLGFASATVAYRVSAGRLHAKHRGVYAVGHAKLSQLGEWLAAVLAVGPARRSATSQPPPYMQSGAAARTGSM